MERPLGLPGRAPGIPLTDRQLENIYFGHIKPSKLLSNYVLYYERLAKGEAHKTYEYLSNSTNKIIEEDRERLNKESCAYGRAYSTKKVGAPVLDADGNAKIGEFGTSVQLAPGE